MEFTLKQVADLLQGRTEGDENAKVSTLCKIEEGRIGGLSFLANPQYEKYIYQTKATAVIVSEDFSPEQNIQTSLIRVKDPYLAFAKLLEVYQEYKNKRSGISQKADIAQDAILGKNVFIGPFVVIESGVTIGDDTKIYANSFVGQNSRIGENCTIYSGVNIYSDTEIGHQCTIHAGAVIGADGFGFAPSDDKSYAKVAQIGNVIIRNRVEIGANTCIDRATLGSTIIEEGVKLDNLIQIAHNVVVGENTVMASQVGIAGSTKIGKRCMFGGQVGLSGHIEIADDVMLAAQSGVPSSLKKEKGVYMGSPAMEAMDYKKSFIYFKTMDRHIKRIDELEKKQPDQEK